MQQFTSYTEYRKIFFKKAREGLPNASDDKLISLFTALTVTSGFDGNGNAC